MIDEDFQAQMLNKQFKTDEFNKSRKNQKQLLRYVKVMPINKDSFNLILSLLRYYGVYILIAFRQYYQRLKPKILEYCLDFDKELKTIASYVKAMLMDQRFPELQFFFQIGILENKLKYKEQYDANEKQFLANLDKIRGIIAQMSKNIQSKNQQILLQEFSQLSKIECVPKDNVFAQYYIEVMREEAKNTHNKILKEIQKYKNSVKMKESHQIQIDSSHSILDPTAAKTPLCCRSYFYLHQMLDEAESMTIQYKNYHYPYDELRSEILLKTMVGFLNLDGGIIYLGVHQSLHSKRRRIQGFYYNQSCKEDVLKTFRRLGQQIEPQIVSNKMYTVEFVPIKQNHKPYDYSSGLNIVKIRILPGKSDQLYCYKVGTDNYKFAFRTENEVLSNRRISQKILQIYRDRLTNPRPPFAPIHLGPCKQPELGIASYSNNTYHQNRYRIDDDREDFIANGGNGNGNGNGNGQKRKYIQKSGNGYYLDERRKSPQERKINDERKMHKVREKEREYCYVVRGTNIRKFELQALNELDFKIKTEQDDEKGIFIVHVGRQKDREFNIFCTKYLNSEKNFQMKPISERISFKQAEGYILSRDVLNQMKILFTPDDKKRILTFPSPLNALKASRALNQFGIQRDYI